MKNVVKVYVNFRMSEKCHITQKRQYTPPQMLPTGVEACLLTILK